MSTTAPFRVATVYVGDSLRIIALRELNDAMRWPELADLNQLQPPYIIESIDAQQRTPHTLLWGDTILIPLSTSATPPTTLKTLYGTDIALQNGQLSALSGDWALATGSTNLLAALHRRLQTPHANLPAHPKYGCNIARIIGFKIQPVALLLGAAYVKSALLDDARIRAVLQLTYQVLGDTVSYAAIVLPIGSSVSLTMNIVFPLQAHT